MDGTLPVRDGLNRELNGTWLKVRTVIGRVDNLGQHPRAAFQTGGIIGRQSTHSRCALMGGTLGFCRKPYVDVFKLEAKVPPSSHEPERDGASGVEGGDDRRHR